MFLLYFLDSFCADLREICNEVCFGFVLAFTNADLNGILSKLSFLILFHMYAF